MRGNKDCRGMNSFQATLKWKFISHGHTVGIVSTRRQTVSTSEAERGSRRGMCHWGNKDNGREEEEALCEKGRGRGRNLCTSAAAPGHYFKKLVSAWWCPESTSDTIHVLTTIGFPRLSLSSRFVSLHYFPWWCYFFLLLIILRLCPESLDNIT